MSPPKTQTVIIAIISLVSISGCSKRERLSGSSLAMQPANTQVLSSSAPSKVITGTNSTTADEFVLTADMEKRAEIELSPVVSQALTKNAVFSSSIEATSKGSAVVNSLVHGIITRVLADLGENVKTGQILCYINCPDLLEAQSGYLTSVAKLQEAKAQIVQVESRIELARAEVDRLHQLNKEGIAATKDLQSAEGRLASIEAELAAVKSMQSASKSYVAAAESRLKSFGISSANVKDSSLINELPLRSPISGVIVKRTVSPGQSINPAGTSGNTQNSAEEGLFSIVDLKKVWVMLEVPQAEVAALKLGAPVDFTSEVAPGKNFKGKVITPGEKFDAASRTVGVRVEISNPDGTLKPGMLVIANARESMTPGAVLTVPNTALQDIDGKTYVFIKIGEHRYRKTAVVTGVSNGESTRTVSGVKAGEKVVTKGSFILKSEALKANLEPHD